jgi:hypothetical protein
VGRIQDRQFAVQRAPGSDRLALVVTSRAPGGFPPKTSWQLPVAVDIDSVVLGTVGQDLRIVCVTAESQALFGFEPGDLTGRLFSSSLMTP